jgi:hypothetical protein
MTMDAKAIRAGPTTTFSPIATIVFFVPHAMILDCDAINKPDKFIINHKKSPFNATLCLFYYSSYLSIYVSISSYY